MLNALYDGHIPTGNIPKGHCIYNLILPSREHILRQLSLPRKYFPLEYRYED